MFEELFSSGALNCVYGAIILISFIFALLSLIGAEVGDALDLDVDADTDGAFDFASVSPFALAMFGAAFGLSGLLSRLWLEMEPLPSIALAAAIGVLFGGAAQAFFIYVLSPSKSSHFSLERDAVGREVEVTITIPEDGRGQVILTNVSGRLTLGARSLTEEPISSGKLVIIEKIVGRIAYVRPIEKK
jgi:hypothetical protein